MTDQKTLNEREQRERSKARRRHLQTLAQVDALNENGAGIKKRKAGSRKAQILTVTQLLHRYRDPRAVLLEIASTPTDDLAEALSCSKLEASQERRHAALAVLPYVASKMPVQVDMRHTRAVHVHFDLSDETLVIDAQQHQEQIIDLSAETIEVGSDEGRGRGQKPRAAIEAKKGD